VQANDLDRATLRRLAELRPPARKVLSVYVDLHPAEFGTRPARATEIGSLLDEAERRVREVELDHAARAALAGDVERVRDTLRNDGGLARGAHGLAIFACGPAGVFELLRLPQAVPPAVVVDDAPWLDPLVGQERARRCLALVSRRALRVLLDDADGELREIAELVDDVHGQHEQGGWSQARYERSVEEDVRRHLQRSAEALFARRAAFDVLAVGASAELWPELERLLHPYVRERVIGRFDVEVEHAGAEEALAAAQPLLDAAAGRRLERLLAQVAAGIGEGEGAVGGAGPVLAALSERRVEALLYEDGFAAAGFACPEAGWVGLDASACPLGAVRADAVENVLDAAIAIALLQSAEVVPLREGPQLGPLGGIAAVLRF
jgi:peptide chain release factor subunit 1